MRQVEIRDAVGLQLGSAVKDEHGRILLAAGTRVTPGLRDVLVRRGFLQVLVRDGVADDVAPRDILSERTRGIATVTARQCFSGVRRGDTLPLQPVMTAVDRILDEVMTTKDAVVELGTLRSVSDYAFVHSVNVCVYSLIIGLDTGLAGDALRPLGAGALLHDIGKVLCADLCNRAGPLSPEDWVRVRQHPIDGFEMLRQHHGLHLFAAHIAYQHHERMDGSGYPRGLRGPRILPLARIVAVADVFDAMTADRPHARALERIQAMTALRQGAGALFDAEIVGTFISRMALYPSGTPVLLADGTVAVVIDQGADAGAPMVRLLGRAGRVFEEAAEVPALADRAIREVLPAWPNWLRQLATAHSSFAPASGRVPIEPAQCT